MKCFHIMANSGLWHILTTINMVSKIEASLFLPYDVEILGLSNKEIEIWS